MRAPPRPQLKPAAPTATHASRVRRIFPRTHSAVVRKSLFGGLFLGALIIAATIAAVATGPVDIPLPNTVRAVLATISGESATSVTSTQQAVIERIRLPRVVLALSVGMALAVAGTIMQAIFRNPLADPGIIGTSAGGALGAVIIISIGLSGSVLWIPAGSIIGSITALLLVFAIAFVGGRMSVATLLLAGVAMGSLLGAAVSTTILLADHITAQREMFFWLAGGFEGATWTTARIVAPIALFGTVLTVVASRDLNLLLLGDDEARSLGINVSIFRIAMVILAAVLTGIAVAFAGVISFVGLIVPHAIRLVTGPDHRHVVLLSALGGSLFVLLADTAARTIISPAELRVGIITAMVGGPAFIALLMTSKTSRSSL